MQSVSSRLWIRDAVFISYDDNNYTTGTSFLIQLCLLLYSCFIGQFSAQIRICRRKRDSLNSLRLFYTTCQQVYFIVPTDPRVKMKESEKVEIGSRHGAEKWNPPPTEKNLKNMKVTVISIFDVLATVPRNLEKTLKMCRLEEELKQSTSALLKSARILRRVLETRRDLLSFRHLWKNQCLSWRKKPHCS